MRSAREPKGDVFTVDWQCLALILLPNSLKDRLNSDQLSCNINDLHRLTAVYFSQGERC